MQNLPSRKVIRYRGYDYSTAGAYFLTICTHQKSTLFGEIADSNMKPNSAGTMIVYWWNELELHFPEVETDYFVVMPNHIHGILMLEESSVVSIPDVMKWYKTMTTNAFIRGVKEQDWTPFDRKVWQRSYYDRIIRSDEELGMFRE